MAAAANAVHKDDGIDLSLHPELIVSKSKIRSQQNIHLRELSAAAVPSTPSLFFDGKRMKTLHQEQLADGQFHQHTEVDDHYVISDASRQSYLGEITVAPGTGEKIAEGIISFVEQKPGLDMK